ncbi:MAG: B12-binding domain-containing protein [Candidatus Promineifilaceae bacterium]
MSANNDPTFNLKVVIRETGLKPDTLRAWERRYGLPDPQRTEGGHRLYTRRDIDMLKWLMARQNEGVSISRAVSLWQGLVAEGKDPLQEHITYDTTVEEERYAPVAFIGSTMTQLREQWVNACLAYDEKQAREILNQAFALYSPESVCFAILQHGLAEIGDGWFRGNITVQQEHFASALAIQRLQALLLASPPPTRPERILVGCSPEDDHTFSPLLICLMLRRYGWDALYLGANVPVVQMERTIETTHPDLVVMSAQLLNAAANLLEMAQLLQQRRIPLAYGGRVFNYIPAIRQRIPGHFLGEEMEEIPHVVSRLLNNRPPMPVVTPVSLEYEQALSQFTRYQPVIEARLWQAASEIGMPHTELTRANQNMAQNIKSALKLGDLNFISSDLAWLSELLFNYHLPHHWLHHYLEVYSQAIYQEINGNGGPIMKWLGKFLAQESMTRNTYTPHENDLG